MRQFTIFVRVLVFAACALLVVAGAQAQYRASIQGLVTDPQGGAVSGATVTLRNLETNQSVSSTTNEKGIFNFNGLPPSNFSLTVEKAGFKKQILDKVGLIAEQANSISIKLEVGQVTESITVNGDSTPLIDTETASGSGTITASEIQKLPSFGRDPFQLLQLAPGAFGDGAQAVGGVQNLPSTTIGGSGGSTGIFAIENGGQITANGARTGENNYTIDGVGMTSVSWGGAAVITPNEDSIKEVKVVTDNYDAEYGRFRGAQVQIVSQNGTNDYHGSLYLRAHRPGLNAFQKYNGPGNAVQKDQNRFNDYGGSVGGPILKNKLFAFFSYETINNNAASTTTQGWFETSQYRALAGAAPNAAKFLTYPGVGPSGGTVNEDAGANQHDCPSIGLVQGVNCYWIPGQGLNLGRPLNSSFAVGAFDPSWASPVTTSSGIQYFPGLGGDGTGSPANLDPTTPTIAYYTNIPNPSTNSQAQYNGRVDFNLTSKDLIAFSMYYVPQTSSYYNGTPRAMNNFDHKIVNNAYTALWDHTFSPTLVNEVRLNGAGWRAKDLSLNPNGPWGLPVAYINDVNNGSSTFSNIVPNTWGMGAPWVFDQWTYAGKDVLTKVSGSHTIKMGGELTRLLFVDDAPWNARPNYYFNNYWNFLNDAASGEQATFNPLTGVPTDFRKDTRSNLFGIFIQDNYKLRPNLTVTLGLRWEYFGPISEKHGNLGTVELGNGVAALTGLRVRTGGTLYRPDHANFGPQVGFAWSPHSLLKHDFNSRLVVRGGFGIAYNGEDEATSLDGRNNPPFLSASGNLTCNPYPSCTTPGNVSYINSFPTDLHSFGGYASNPAAIATFDPATNLPVPGTQNFAPVGLTGYSPSWPSTASYHYTLQGEYDLGHEWVASLEYQGSTTRHLTEQYNMYVVQASLGRMLNPVVSGLAWQANDGSAHFNALLGQLRHRFSQSFQVEAQYRFSSSIDTGSNEYEGGQYQYNLATNMGPSAYDVRHALKVFGVWSPRIFHGSNRWMEKVAGGWSLSGIANWHTGFPWTPVYSEPDAVFQGSSGYGGTNLLRPATYLGGAGSGHGNGAFEQANGNFPGGGSKYFVPPDVVPGPSIACLFPNPPVATCPTGQVAMGPIPTAPGVGRNSFRGPRYFDLDATISKSFGLPKLKVVGERARLEFRANIYNLFNNVNLTNVDTTVTDAHFGAALGALGARVIEMQARFNF